VFIACPFAVRFYRRDNHAAGNATCPTPSRDSAKNLPPGRTYPSKQPVHRKADGRFLRKEPPAMPPRCINCKQDLLTFAAARLPDFQPDLPPKSLSDFCRFAACEPNQPDISGSSYPLVKPGPDGCFHHLELRRGFCDGKIYLRLTNLYASYLKHSWDIAQCTHKVSNNGYYSRLGTVPERARANCPWITTENDKNALAAGLDRLADWYLEHREELETALQKQQDWVDKEMRSYRTARTWLKDRLEEPDQAAVFALYRQVDRLAGEYNAAKDRGDFRYGGPMSFFSDWCRGKLAEPYCRWEDELAEAMMTGKKRVTDDPDYAHSFAVSCLLYFAHDAAKDRWPEILTAKPWKEG